MSRLLGAFCAVLVLSSSVFGQAKLDYRQQKERLRELEASGVTRRSGRTATDLR